MSLVALVLNLSFAWRRQTSCSKATHSSSNYELCHTLSEGTPKCGKQEDCQCKDVRWLPAHSIRYSPEKRLEGAGRKEEGS
jgi:hypothetical protein